MNGPRVAVVGCGLMGRWHAEYCRRAGGQVIALVDRDERAALELARRFPAASPLDADGSWLTATDLDVVHVCTPTASHSDLVARALSAGCHVLVEKPLARSLAETRDLLDRARQARLRLAPVHQLPFQRGLRRLRRELGRLGEPLDATYSVLSAGGEGLSARGRRAVLLEMLPHAVSLFYALGLSAPPAQWQLRCFDSERLELAAETGGTSLRIFCSLSGRPTRHELQVVGSRATATADLFHGYSLRESGQTGRLGKILLPLRRGSQQLTRAGGNLVWRALRRQPAYPGLPELIAAFYRSTTEHGSAAIDREEILIAAALHDRVAGD